MEMPHEPASSVSDAQLEALDAASETYRALLDMAHGGDRQVPAEVLAEHILAVTEGGDWPVVRAAMAALLRRYAFAERDSLRVVSRPGHARLGRYGIARREGRGRASTPRYSTVLLGVTPPAGSCDCPDFVRSSLGLCKHLLVALEDVYRSPRKLVAACREQAQGPPRRRLRWDPVRPLLGAGDWLERVHIEAAAGRREPQRLARIRRYFDATGHLLDAGHDRREHRRELVDALLPAARADGNDPALVALLARESLRLTRVLRDVPLARRRQARPTGLKRTLYPYQLEGVRRFFGSGSLLLADDMGLGKTVQAIAACHTLLCEGRVRRAVFIVPASLKPQWLREWQGTTAEPAQLVEGTPAERAAQYRGLRRGVLIMGYSQLLRDLPHVRALAPDLVVLDEAQRIKNWATKTATFVKSLQPPYRLVLTGTPMENRLGELASLFDWVDDLALEPKWRLEPWHTVNEADGESGWAGARNLDTLRLRIAASMVRRVRADVLSQLPARTDVRVPVELTEAQRAAHNELNQPIAALAAIARRRPLSPAQFLRLMSLLTTQRMICNGMAQVEFEQVWETHAALTPTPRLLERLAAPKLLELRRLIEDVVIAQGRKVVIFSQWRRMLRLAGWAMSDLLGAAGLRAVFFTGRESARQREQGVVELHDDPATRVMLLSDAGGVGLNLQRAATCCINLELPWNPAVLEQRIGRIHRLGQEQPIDIYNLVSEGGIEGRIAGLVADKQALFSGLFDGASNEVRFESSGTLTSRLEALIEPIEVPESAAPDTGDAAVDSDPPADLDTEPARDEADALVALADESSDVPGPTLEPGPATGAHASAPRAAEHADVARLLSSMEVSRTPAGGMRIDAPPEAAAVLATMFGKLAEMLAAQAGGPPASP